MKEVGIINRDIAAVISEQGHGDLLMVTDAGFAIPLGVEVIDLALKIEPAKHASVISKVCLQFISFK